MLCPAKFKSKLSYTTWTNKKGTGSDISPSHPTKIRLNNNWPWGSSSSLPFICSMGEEYKMAAWFHVLSHCPTKNYMQVGQCQSHDLQMQLETWDWIQRFIVFSKREGGKVGEDLFSRKEFLHPIHGTKETKRCDVEWEVEIAFEFCAEEQWSHLRDRAGYKSIKYTDKRHTP